MLPPRKLRYLLRIRKQPLGLLALPDSAMLLQACWTSLIDALGMIVSAEVEALLWKSCRPDYADIAKIPCLHETSEQPLGLLALLDAAMLLQACWTSLIDALGMMVSAEVEALLWKWCMLDYADIAKLPCKLETREQPLGLLALPDAAMLMQASWTSLIDALGMTVSAEVEALLWKRCMLEYAATA